MRSRIKWFHSADIESVDSDFEHFTPEDPSDAIVGIQVMVGSADSDGAESFAIEVITPNRLASKVRAEGPTVGRHLLIVDRWDWPVIKAKIEELFEGQEGADWDELGERLGRYGHWEFEDEDRWSQRVPSDEEVALLKAVFGTSVVDESDGPASGAEPEKQ